MNNTIYTRKVSYHDKDLVPQNSVLTITTRNNYVEFTMRNPDSQSDFNPKDGSQTELHNLWNNWHIKKYCELDDEDKIDELTTLCDDICDNVEEEEEEYLESLDVKTEADIDDDRIIALMRHLDITPEEAYDDIEEARYGDSHYEYGNQEYQVLTDSEADNLWDEYLDSYIDECILDQLPEAYRNYFDSESWKHDAKNDGRGHSLSTYDGREYEEDVNGTTYYIYRKN